MSTFTKKRMKIGVLLVLVFSVLLMGCASTYDKSSARLGSDPDRCRLITEKSGRAWVLPQISTPNPSSRRSRLLPLVRQKPIVEFWIVVGLSPGIVLRFRIHRQFHVFAAGFSQAVNHSFRFHQRHGRVFAAVERPATE